MASTAGLGSSATWLETDVSLAGTTMSKANQRSRPSLLGVSSGPASGECCSSSLLQSKAPAWAGRVLAGAWAVVPQKRLGRAGHDQVIEV